MADPQSANTIRAVVDTILPSAEGRTGGVELGADQHAVEQLDKYLPGFPDMVAALFDAFASDERTGASFTDLSPQERGNVLRAMASDESQDIREALDSVTIFALGGAYSEWSARGETPPRPRVWDEIGYPGPSEGYPEYRRGI